MVEVTELLSIKRRYSELFLPREKWFGCDRPEFNDAARVRSYGLCESPSHLTFPLALSPCFEVVAIALASSVQEAAALSSLLVEVKSSQRSPARAGKLGQLADVYCKIENNSVIILRGISTISL